MGWTRAAQRIRQEPAIVEWPGGLAAAVRLSCSRPGGTAKAVVKEVFPSKDVARFSPAGPDAGRARGKRCNPKVHAGCSTAAIMRKIRSRQKEHGIAPIDLVFVNLYPFEATAGAAVIITARSSSRTIDIGGPTMLAIGGEKFLKVCRL